MYNVDKDESCVVATDGNNSIKIEVWEVSESYLDKIEKTYGYYSDFEEYPQDYKKEEITSPFGKITMYFTNVKQSEKDIVLKSAVVELEKEQLIFSDGKETEVNNNLI